MSDRTGQLRDIFQRAGLGPSLEGVGSLSELGLDPLDPMVDALEKTATAHAKIFSADPAPSPNIDALEAMLASNPHRATAFLQALLSVSEPSMLTMVWRVLHGDEIVAVSMRYGESDRFELVVELRTQGEGGQVTSHRTHDITCAPLVSQFGIIIIDGEPAFAGFYAHRL